MSLAASGGPRIFGQTEAASSGVQQVEAQTNRPSTTTITIALVGPPRRVTANSVQAAPASRAIGMA